MDSVESHLYKHAIWFVRKFDKDLKGPLQYPNATELLEYLASRTKCNKTYYVKLLEGLHSLKG